MSKARESLMSIERMLQYLAGGESGWPDRKVDRDRLHLMGRDVKSLTDQLAFLSSKTTFLLDATLGLISVEQNDVIRVLTVAATILLPPTLIGTIYGMNFVSMPELKWSFGYPLAIGADGCGRRRPLPDPETTRLVLEVLAAITPKRVLFLANRSASHGAAAKNACRPPSRGRHHRRRVVARPRAGAPDDHHPCRRG